MSPDIEWRVGEDAEQETIAHTTNARRPRRHLWVLISAIGLGVGLGLLYRSIPEPPPHPIDPAPAPLVNESPLSPLPTPQSLDAAIERDAQHLASLNTNNEITFNPALARMPQAYADWYAALQNANGRWGPPSYQTLYTVFETGTLPSGTAWVKMGQFRNGDFYRQTRFYQLQDNRWEWTLPDRSFWSGVVRTRTFAYPGADPFTINYPVEDEALIPTVGDRFARALAYLCASLNCPSEQSAAPSRSQSITLTVVIDPAVQTPYSQPGPSKTLTITMPSLRVVGYYENPNRSGDPLNSIVYDTLIDPITQLASGDYERWSRDRGGEVFLQAIADWQRTQVKEVIQPSALFFKGATSLPGFERVTTTPRAFYAAALRGGPLVPLISLGGWSSEDTRFGLFQSMAQTEAESVVAFIQEHYGEESVIRFLNALGKSTSLDKALEAGLPVSFGEFNRQWTKWIDGE